MKKRCKNFHYDKKGRTSATGLQQAPAVRLQGSTDPSRRFRYSESIPFEVPARKLIYLVERLKKTDNALAPHSAEMLNMILISTGPQEPEGREFFYDIMGEWRSPYGKKKTIVIYLSPFSNGLEEDSVRGTRRFSYQSGFREVPIRGTFVDKGDLYEIHMEEYKVPFEEEFQWKQDAINEDWGGPEKFYPHALSYGLFDFKIDKKTKQMNGTWSSKSGKIVRKFTIPKTGN